jgi:hypothetical protein
MRSASTGLAHLPEEATAASRPIPIVPEVLPCFLRFLLLLLLLLLLVVPPLHVLTCLLCASAAVKQAPACARHGMLLRTKQAVEACVRRLRQVRRPSLPPGRGSLSDMSPAGSFRQLSTHPSHALPTPSSPPNDALFSGAYPSCIYRGFDSAIFAWFAQHAGGLGYELAMCAGDLDVFGTAGLSSSHSNGGFQPRGSASGQQQRAADFSAAYEY